MWESRQEQDSAFHCLILSGLIANIKLYRNGGNEPYTIPIQTCVRDERITAHFLKWISMKGRPVGKMRNITQVTYQKWWDEAAADWKMGQKTYDTKPFGVATEEVIMPIPSFKNAIKKFKKNLWRKM